MAEFNAAIALLGDLEANSSRVAIEEGCGSGGGSVSWTYGEIRQLSLVYAEAISSLIEEEPGADLGPRVGFLLDPGAEYVSVLLACWWRQAVAFPIGDGLGVQERTCALLRIEPQPSALGMRSA